MQSEDEVDEMTVGHETSVSPPAFDVLFDDLHDRLYRALYFITGSSADAEELAQDAFLKLWERWDTIASIEDPTAWLFRVALNGFRVRVRRARVAARKLLPGPPPPDPYEEIELREDVRRLLLELPARQRAALVPDRDLRLQLRGGRADPRHQGNHCPRAGLARAGHVEGEVRRP